MSRIFALTWLLLSAAALAPQTRAQSAPAPTEAFEFGTIGLTDEFQHTFEFTNNSAQALEIENVELTPPLIVTKMPSRIPPGERANVTVRLETPREKSDFRGSVVVNFKNEASAPRVFWVVGKIVPPIEFDPFPIFFLSTLRGQEKTASLEIINHEPDSLEIRSVENPSSRFIPKLETLEAGRRYRLSLTMTGNGTAGRAADTVTLVTSSRSQPFLEIRANTMLNERVHSFPDAIDFGPISAAYLKAHPEELQAMAKRVMIYQEEGKNFQVSATTDVPFLITSTSQAQLKDRYEVRLSVVPEKLRAGPIKGVLVIDTNDPMFPRLTIPITAAVEDSW
jgi:Protein of unknown function (DUF1573)